MVQYKKSPVAAREPPLHPYLHPDCPIWVLPSTGEAFVSYDEYLAKLDYYKQKVFTCEITGHGRLSYFDALASEQSGTLAMESAFPQALREPLLRKVQFQQIGRLDNLVNFLYDEFIYTIQPGERVVVEVDESGRRVNGTAREVYSFAATPERDQITRYMVDLDEGGDHALVDHHHCHRPPRSFTKQLLRSFLRHAVERENYDNAPWTIKMEVAKAYGIDNTLPRHLTQDAIQAWRKVTNALEKSKVELSRVIPKRVDDFEEMTRTIIEHKGKMPTELVTRFASAYKGIKDPSSVSSGSSSGASLKPASKSSKAESAAVAPPEIKYPREDLEVKPKAGANTKPALHHQKDDKLDLDPETSMQSIASMTDISLGKALSIWSTLNIHSKFFTLDSFTYDDFVGAMLYNGEEAACELFEEMHCTVLKSLVNKEGETEAMIPSLDDLSLSSDSSQDTSTASTPKRESSIVNNQKFDASSGNSSPLSDVDQSKLNGSMTNGTLLHNAKEMLDDYSWKERIKDRAFENGGWQVIMVGLLYHLSQGDWVDDAPDRVLRELAPVHQAATQEVARKAYAKLDVNLRLSALECVLMLACTSKTFREAMDARAMQQTTDRKDKTDAQRRRKPLIDELAKLDTERKMNRPDGYDDPLIDGDDDADDMEVDDSEREIKPDSDDSDADSEPMRGRRRSGRATDLKRKHEHLKREQEAKAIEAKHVAQNSERAAYEKIVAEYEAKRAEIRACEEEIELVDGKLRENSCHRTRNLGLDRFCNRYWWFERNGMPFLGHEDSSTADYGYMNGRIWVQGPGKMEREGYFDITERDAAKYREMAGCTPTERRSKEQGHSVLPDDTAWGYYSTPDELRALIAWLDERGDRERKLLKEISRWRSNIFMTMEGRQAHLENLTERRRQLAEEPIGIATRKKTHTERDKLRHPCLAWQNGEALRQLGQLHSDGQGRNKMRGIARPKGHVGFIAANQVLPGKRETRRGTKY